MSLDPKESSDRGSGDGARVRGDGRVRVDDGKCGERGAFQLGSEDGHELCVHVAKQDFGRDDLGGMSDFGGDVCDCLGVVWVRDKHDAQRLPLGFVDRVQAGRDGAKQGESVGADPFQQRVNCVLRSLCPTRNILKPGLLFPVERAVELDVLGTLCGNKSDPDGRLGMDKGSAHLGQDPRVGRAFRPISHHRTRKLLPERVFFPSLQARYRGLHLGQDVGGKTRLGSFSGIRTEWASAAEEKNGRVI